LVSYGVVVIRSKANNDNGSSKNVSKVHIEGMSQGNDMLIDEFSMDIHIDEYDIVCDKIKIIFFVGILCGSNPTKLLLKLRERNNTKKNT
jgi:hypothetical protein